MFFRDITSHANKSEFDKCTCFIDKKGKTTLDNIKLGNMSAINRTLVNPQFAVFKEEVWKLLEIDASIEFPNLEHDMIYMEYYLLLFIIQLVSLYIIEMILVRN